MNFHTNRGDFLLKIRSGPWGGPWTGPMDRVHGVVHGPRSMFCIRPNIFKLDLINGSLRYIFRSAKSQRRINVLVYSLIRPVFGQETNSEFH